MQLGRGSDHATSSQDTERVSIHEDQSDTADSMKNEYNS